MRSETILVIAIFSKQSIIGINTCKLKIKFMYHAKIDGKYQQRAITKSRVHYTLSINFVFTENFSPKSVWFKKSFLVNKIEKETNIYPSLTKA